jgi:hypothetical protein
LTELSSVTQLWTTSYGRALLVKTAIFAAVLLLVWLSHRRYLPVQLALLAALVLTVGALTDLRPGRARSALAAAPAPVGLPPSPPPAGAYVDARQAGPLAVGFAWRNGKSTVTLVGPDGTVVHGAPVHTTTSGRTVRVTVAGKTVRFTVPRTLRPAAAALRRATRLYDGARAITIVEKLSSRPGIGELSIFHERAPNRLAYRIVASTEAGIAGRQAVVIGGQRWDRTGKGPWRKSQYGAIRVPQTYWGPHPVNAYFSGPSTLTFFDPDIHAWYRLRLDRSGRPAELMMVAGAHFMHHDYSFRSPPISPPSR